MTMHQKPLWEEGMFLAPQHFQQLDRSIDDRLREAQRSSTAYFWGFTEIRIDLDRLESGILAVQSARGAFDDGTVFHIPEGDPPPNPLQLDKAVSPTQTSIDCYLALPTTRGPAARVAAPRYRRRLTSVVDQNRQDLERDIPLAELNLSIQTAEEEAGDFTRLPFARVQALGNQQYALDDRFVPPTLYFGASDTLRGMVQRILQLLASKSRELAEQRGARIAGTAQLAMNDATAFWLLGTVNRFLPIVRNLHAHPQSHPEQLYNFLVSLAGELTTFEPEAAGTAGELPIYSHRDPTSCFQQLEQAINRLPGNLYTDRSVDIPLSRINDIWQGQIHDPALAERADFYLAVRGEQSDEKIIREFPALAKVSSPQLVSQLRNLAVRGAPLEYMQDPPPDIIRRTGFHYFRIHRDNEHWRAVTESRTLAMFVPPEFVDTRVECIAIRGL